MTGDTPRAARPVATPGLDFRLDPQPDEVSCGPACLQGVYRHFGHDVSIDTLTREIPMLDDGGTLGVFLANHALQLGFRATLFSYNVQLFDPTWFALPTQTVRERLRAQAQHKSESRLQHATRGYDEFLQIGGALRFRDLDPSLIRHYLKREVPIITGLSATYLYQDTRTLPDTDEDDDIRGDPVGHFVVLTGYDSVTREIVVADPYPANPLTQSHHYAVNVHRLIGAIFLGCTTYDANLLVIEPSATR